MKFEERYQLQVPLSQSERGTVWKAHDAKLAREVAVAVVESDAPEELRARFEEQMTKLVPLRHANVVRVFEAGKNAEGDPFASMELVEGVSLATRMHDGPPMRVDQAVRMIVDLLGALTTLHAAGIAHGDIEPGNIFIKEAGGRVTPKLVGLGLNRAEQRAGKADADEGHLHVLAYASPAQARGEVADSASDVYSTAAVLFTLLTGRLPHRGADAEAMRASLRDRNVPAVGDVREELAGPVADAIDGALGPEAKDRPESADALAKTLRGALIKMRNPGSIETIVGARTTEADASDDELSAKRTEPRGPKPVAAAKSAFAAKATMPGKPAALPPRKPAAPKPISNSAIEKLPFERISGLFEDAPTAKPTDSGEFESISGLLEIKSDAPPKIVHPAPALKLPPPAKMPKEKEPEPAAKVEPPAAESASLFADHDEPIEELGEEPAPDLHAAPTLIKKDAPKAEPVAEAAPPPPKAEPAPIPDEPIDSRPIEEDYAVPKARIPVWVWAAGGVAIAAMIGVGVLFAMGDDEPAVAATDDPPSDPIEAPRDPEPPAIPDPPPDEPEVAVPDPVEPEPEPEPEPVVLTFRGVPDGASVTIDGEDVEGDRVELAPTEEERHVEVRLDGHRPWSRTIAGSESAELGVELERIREEPPPRRVEPERRPEPRAERREPRPERPRQTGGRHRRPVAAQDPGF